MKFSLAALLTPSVLALQSGYLTELTGSNRASPAFVPNSGGLGQGYATDAAGANTATPTPRQGSLAGPSRELLDLWSSQVSVELSASQLYLSASIWFRARGMKGMAAWMLDESGEERGHGLAILEFAMKKQFPVTLQPLAAPRDDWQNPVEVWEDILNAEQTNTQNLLKLAAAADSCGEYGCMAFLDPFHTEQIDAEDKVGGILEKVRNAPQLMHELDHMLGIEAESEEHH
mmetsp:Transcript_1545/g.2111  ORF Transcript_1545/g.2111 Transcript_1545/m.2111 type:complete len:231 (-) Transcript_1545:212-904(-)|eukprot:CAMPEP_0178904690 /NCGR_PEP_ID=MMETSP0786-20121207/5837_1 /TAXON_ID=186022 /ORGANISM="Thalassionema frauenfeldii, Strain CCMP 1798" /LENGTH=230 /DNA_ID=CAMNT_0020576169 /DNA_START=97 /DNA_END=789 /DNA_ORIENTATION=+